MNWGSLFGLVCVVWSIWIEIRKKQLYVKGLLMMLSGLIVFFQGWRLDPILQFSYVLLILASIVSTQSNKSGYTTTTLRSTSAKKDVDPSNIEGGEENISCVENSEREEIDLSYINDGKPRELKFTKILGGIFYSWNCKVDNNGFLDSFQSIRSLLFMPFTLTQNKVYGWMLIYGILGIVFIFFDGLIHSLFPQTIEEVLNEESVDYMFLSSTLWYPLLLLLRSSLVAGNTFDILRTLIFSFLEAGFCSILAIVPYALKKFQESDQRWSPDGTILYLQKPKISTIFSTIFLMFLAHVPAIVLFTMW